MSKSISAQLLTEANDHHLIAFPDGEGHWTSSEYDIGACDAKRAAAELVSGLELKLLTAQNIISLVERLYNLKEECIENCDPDDMVKCSACQLLAAINEWHKQS